MFAAAEEGDYANVLDLDLQFHQQIWVMADHGRLETYLREIAGQVKMYSVRSFLPRSIDAEIVSDEL